ncbi:MAG: DUF4450 domain-containing protein [Bacteroides sp.]|nr:DUF4450 domain-containing protein [Bacteroides sp.]
MKRLTAIFIFSWCVTAVWPQYATKSNKVKGAGDLIESTSFNDHKRGTERSLQYLPDGEDFVCVNGKNRYTRALYGSPTAWRLETSDRPIFATFVKNNCRNICFRLHLPDGTVTPLEETSFCEARYTPGRRSYRLKDESWGKSSELRIVALPSMTEEQALWEFSGNLPEGTVIEAIVSPIRNPKLSRNGDMGADAPLSFDPIETGEVLQRLECALSVQENTYIKVKVNSLEQSGNKQEFLAWEADRQTLAGRIRMTTPDPFINTIGGALAVAADGVWGTEEVWLHGAVGWRMPLSGWRAGYIGDALGWHDRARKHFNNYAASQVTEVPCTRSHPAQDSTLALARSVKEWGTPHYSNGYICRNPQRNNQMHHYDMNLCYIDELLWHLQWTGDLDYARQIWPVIQLHLAWEKRNFDPDGDSLYDAYACIWASDALYYNSGAVTHSSAYNYRANRLAALIASKIGEDSTPYQQEADRILKGLNERLWMPEAGHWAEFQDFMGHKRLHKSAGVWTIYHALDSDVATPEQAYQATRYIDEQIPHLPVRVAEGTPYADEINSASYATIATTNWLPYSWSINNVAFAEVMHTALAYFQANRPEEGFKLLKSSVLDGMYLGESPGNFGQVSFYDAARGECYRDFGDPIGVASRLFIQGLYGILPDALNNRLLVRPGFPSAWEHASLHTPDIDFDFKQDDKRTHYTLKHRLIAVKEVELHLPAIYTKVASLKVNGKKADWTYVPAAMGRRLIAVKVSAIPDESLAIDIKWNGSKIEYAAVEPFAAEVKSENLPKPFEHIEASKCETVDMNQVFNAKVTDIFQNEYLSPRSPYTTLQIPKQGIGEWCHPLKTANIDDKGLREKVEGTDVLQTELGISFRTPAEGRNIAYTSLWDNYPDELSIPLQGKGKSLYLLMAGSTNHMQCHIDNGYVRAYYTDGTYSELPLVNPYNWAPIEQLFFEDGWSYNRNRYVPGSTPLPLDYGSSPLYRLQLKTGRVSNRLAEEIGFPGVTRELDGGAGILLELPVDSSKELSHLTVEAVSNEVVIGLMGVTIQR